LDKLILATLLSKIDLTSINNYRGAVRKDKKRKTRTSSEAQMVQMQQAQFPWPRHLDRLGPNCYISILAY
jgi:hypothetical protein